MLVLGRRPGQTIEIGPDIRVTVTAVNGRQVRLGIEAPAELVILRQELREDARSAHSEGSGS